MAQTCCKREGDERHNGSANHGMSAAASTKAQQRLIPIMDGLDIIVFLVAT
jgi:hypothetical protein